MRFSERLVSAAFGLTIGALLGAVVAWLLGTYSHTLGASRQSVDALEIVCLTSLFFGAVGFLFGTSVGSLAGSTLAVILNVERHSSNPEVPRWVAVALLALVVAAVWWQFG